MSTSSSRPYADYQELAQQSLAAWQSLWSKALGDTPQPSSPGLGGATPAAVARALEGLKNYCSWLETMGAATATTPDGLDWNEAFAKAFGDNPAAPFLEAFGDFASAGGERWMPSFLRLSAPLQEAMRGYLDLPMFGLAREHQVASQRLGKAWLDYSEQASRYQGLIARVGRLAAERLADKLAEDDAPSRQIDSLRDLYNLWVDAAEDVYAEVALSDEFREIYGAMVNAQMRVRQLTQKQVEESSAQLGVPTRSEVDSIGKRLQELRRAASPAAIEAMRAELAELRAELADLRDAERRADKPARRAAAKSAKTAAVGNAVKAAAKRPAARNSAPRKSATKSPRK